MQRFISTFTNFAPRFHPVISALTCFCAVQAILSCWFLPPARAACVPYAEYFHALGGYDLDDYPCGMEYAAPYLFIAEYNGILSVLDVSDPARMSPAGSLILAASLRDLEVSGHLACLVLEARRIQLVDVTRPDAPALLGSAAVPSSPYAVALAGSYAYVAAAQFMGESGVYVFDISDPLAPVLVNLVDVGFYPVNIGIDGGYAYVLTGEGVTVLDLADPVTPAVVGSLEIPGASRYLAFRDDHLFIVCHASDEERAYGDGLYIVDRSDPAHPWLVGSYAPETRAPLFGVALWEHYAIIAGGQDGIGFIDISDPAAPQVAQYVGAQDWAVQFCVTGSVLFACSERLVSYALQEPFTPAPLAGIPETEHCLALASLGDYAYTARAPGGEFLVIDMSAPLQPRIAGVEPLASDYAYEVAVGRLGKNVYAYVTGMGHPDTTAILDVTDPCHPRTAGSLIIPHHPSDLDIQDDYLYACCGSADVRIYHLADPLHPELVSTIEFTYSPQMLAVAGTRLYVGRRISNMEHLFIYDITDAAHPQLLGTSFLPELPYEIVIRGDLAYIADGTGGLLTLDVSDPALPVAVNRLEAMGRPQDLEIVDDRAYVVDWGGCGGVHVVDITNPAAPEVIGYFRADRPWEMEVINDCALVTGSRSKVIVAPLDCAPSALPGCPDSSPAPGAARLSWSANPTRGDLAIRFSMRETGPARLWLVDAAGRLVRVLHDGYLEAGPQAFHWDGRDGAGRPAAAGVHYLSLRTAGARAGGTFVLMR
jgi:hypothetical protein